MASIAQHAYDAGWRGDDLLTAVAVAYAESGGNPLSYNPESAASTPTGKGSYGLWQVYLKAHPEFAGWDLYDPATNARAAYRVWQARRSFWPWSTYQHNSHVKYLPKAAIEVAAINVGSGSAPLRSFSRGEIALMIVAGILGVAGAITFDRWLTTGKAV